MRLSQLSEVAPQNQPQALGKTSAAGCCLLGSTKKLAPTPSGAEPQKALPLRSKEELAEVVCLQPPSNPAGCPTKQAVSSAQRRSQTWCKEGTLAARCLLLFNTPPMHPCAQHTVSMHKISESYQDIISGDHARCNGVTANLIIAIFRFQFQIRNAGEGPKRSDKLSKLVAIKGVDTALHTIRSMAQPALLRFVTYLKSQGLGPEALTCHLSAMAGPAPHTPSLLSA